MEARIEHVMTTGVEHIDEVEAEIDNNTWIVGDDDEVIVIDPARDAPAILDEVGEREVLAVVCTSGHPDIVGAAMEVAERDEAPVFVHPREKLLWRESYPDDAWDEDLAGGGVFAVADVTLKVLHTPGISRGAVGLYSEGLGAVFTGKTLLADAPGKVGDDYPDLPSQLTSIGEHLLTLPDDTRILPAHGKEGVISGLQPHFDDWVSGRIDPAVIGLTAVSTTADDEEAEEESEVLEETEGGDESEEERGETPKS